MITFTFYDIGQRENKIFRQIKTSYYRTFISCCQFAINRYRSAVMVGTERWTLKLTECILLTEENVKCASHFENKFPRCDLTLFCYLPPTDPSSLPYLFYYIYIISGSYSHKYKICFARIIIMISNLDTFKLWFHFTHEMWIDRYLDSTFSK